MSLKLFNEWDVSGVKVSEQALVPYIKIQEVFVPRTGARYAGGQRIWVQKTHIVERLMNKLQVVGHKGKKHRISSGHMSGKSTKQYAIVKDALKIVEKKTGKNPVQVLITAVENGAPREEVTGIEYGGARYAKAVEMSPLRRIDYTLRFMAQGAYQKAFKKKKTIANSLAEEILAAYKMDNQNSTAVQKKLELERQADSSR